MIKISGSLLSGTICILLLSGLAGCSKSGAAKKSSVEDNSSAYKTSTVSLPATAEDFIPPQGNYGTVTQCPVNGEKVTIGKNTPAAKYLGKEYYFCCPMCLKEFRANPKKYSKSGK